MALNSRSRTITRANSDKGLLYANITVGVVSASLCIALAIVAWLALPGEVRVFLPGKYGGAEFGSLPAIQILAIDIFMATAAIAWIVLVLIVWPRRRLVRAVIPIATYLLGVGTLVGLIVAQDSADGMTIFAALFAAVAWGLLITLFSVNLAGNPRTRRRR